MMKIDKSWRSNIAQEVTNIGLKVVVVGLALHCLQNFHGHSAVQHFKQGLKWSVIPAGIGLANSLRKISPEKKWELRERYTRNYRVKEKNKWPIMFKIVATAIAVPTLFLLDRHIGAPLSAKMFRLAERVAPPLARFQLWMTKWSMRGLGLCVPTFVVTGLAQAIKVSIEDDPKRPSMN